MQITPENQLYAHIVFTILSIAILPAAWWLIKRGFKAKDALDEERHQTLLTKINSFCKENHDEHNELFTARREIEKKIEKIDTIHKMKGCDQPFLKAQGNEPKPESIS